MSNDIAATLRRFRSPAVRQSGEMDHLVRQAVFGTPEDRDQARWLIWEIGQHAGVRPASIHELYLARGRGEVRAFTTPAINVRVLAYDSGRAVFRAARPQDVTVSVGAEIGEVGGKNSDVHELRAFMAGYNRTLQRLGRYAGISKISVQTGTSHGGVVLPDGSMAKVQLDLEALRALSLEARTVYGLGGAVQHGASTLPPEAFGHFPACEAIEIHLATNFQNIVFDHARLPTDLRAELKGWVKAECQDEWKKGDTEQQFIYKSRKKAIGPFKQRLWDLPEDVRGAIGADLERTFAFLFEQLRVAETRAVVDRHVTPPLASHAAPRAVAVAAPDDVEAGE